MFDILTMSFISYDREKSNRLFDIYCTILSIIVPVPTVVLQGHTHVNGNVGVIGLRIGQQRLILLQILPSITLWVWPIDLATG